MFDPEYTVTNKLLENIKRIVLLVNKLNQRRFPEPVLVELRENAEAVSAFASTNIEGNPLPLTDVKHILKNRPENIRDSEQEVLNYNQILKDINSKLEYGHISVTLKLILLIQKKVVNKLLPASQSGTLRHQPVFVNDPRLKKTIYWPPEYSDVPNLMQELIQFVEQSEERIDPLILAGIFHKQMVIVHPFIDGNGRTTRLLTKILLAEMSLNTFNLFSFENYYNDNVAKYFENVGVKGNYYDIWETIDFTPWLEYFTDGIIDELLRVEKLLPKHILSPKSELKPHHQKIIEFIRQKGFITNHDYSKLTKRARATRYLDFEKIIKLGFIERKGKSKATYYVLK